MKWLRCCYCCCSCWFNPDKASTQDDSSSLIEQDRHTLDNATHFSQVHEFYVPRRHSSFQPSTVSAVSTQPGRSQSDSCSSSSEEGTPEQRGRCWSTIPATSATDVGSLIANRRGIRSTANSREMSGNESPSGKLHFDRHILDEISEGEQQDTSSGRIKQTDEVLGYLTFTTAYDDQEQRLSVFLHQAVSLPKKVEEPYSTFVRMSLTSSPKNFRVSRAVKKSLSPCYKEEHVFHANRSKWKTTQGTRVHLRLTVVDCDRQGRHDALGHALLPLNDLDSNEEDHKLPLTSRSQPAQNLGQVLVGLLYSPIQSRLAVHVIKGRHLQLDPQIHKRQLRAITKDPLDTFCKVTLTCGGEKVKTCRSDPVTGSDPFFDFKTNFIVPPQYLRDTSVIVAVVTRSTLGRPGAVLGRTTPLGPYVELGDGSATQWGKMIQEGRQVVQWRNIYL